MAYEPVFRGLQSALRTTKDARSAVDRNVGRVLAGLNVTSHQEIVRLHNDVRELEREVAALTERAVRAERLLARRRERDRRTAAADPRPPR